MLFSWLKSRRRGRLQSRPLSPEWLHIMREKVPHYRCLDSAAQTRLHANVAVFIAEKNWEGCAGLQLTDEIKVTIATLACLLLLGIEHDYFSHVLSILVYPTAYAVPQSRAHGESIIEGRDLRYGEAWYRGPVILSWKAIERDLTRAGRGRNLVWHEFAHQLDYLDRATDGTPPLENRQQYRQWHEVMSHQFEQLNADAQLGRRTLLDPYGASNEAEFFAVATECFFEIPLALKEHHPDLYKELKLYYKQDPASQW